MALVEVPAALVTEIFPLAAFAGTVAVIRFADTTVNRAFTAPNLTAVAPSKPVPRIATVVPVRPRAGANPVIDAFAAPAAAAAAAVGVAFVSRPGHATIVCALGLLAVPAAVVTVIFPVVAPFGTAAVIVESDPIWT